MNIGRLYRTVRYLTFCQIWFQVWRRVQRKIETHCAAKAAQGDLPAFTFLNLTAKPKGWNDPALDMLWRYNLHYFDYLLMPQLLSATNVRSPQDLIEQWIAENPRGSVPGWDPYPTSLRIVNWVKWLEKNELTPHMLASLAAQVKWLSHHLEWHLLANHLLADLKALVIGNNYLLNGAEGTPPPTKKSVKIRENPWIKNLTLHWLRLYKKELAKQVLPDGGHYERSVMYHAIILEDVLDILHFCGSDAADLKPIAARMLRYLVNMTGSDGKIVLFNDAADGIAKSTDALRERARALGIEVADAESFVDFPETGYARLTAGDFVLFVDAAQIGPDCQPGHSHADTLTYELYYKGRKVVADTGTSEYRGARRAFERSTAAHNVVEVDGRNSSEVWSSHRVGSRARIVTREVASTRVFAAHNGYGFLVGRELHLSSEGLTVAERVSGQGKCVTRVHLTDAFAESGLALSRGLAEGGIRTEEDFKYAVQFGKLAKGRCVAGSFDGGNFEYTIRRIS